MKRSLFAASTATALGILSIGADTMAQDCSRNALDTARALARQYCETVKDADVDRVVIRPIPPPGSELAIIGLIPACTRTHSLICKQHMANLVSEDSWCSRLYQESFNFSLKDEFTGEEEQANSRSIYDRLQREGCKLH